MTIKRIVGYRKMLGLNQKEMAEKLNISVQSYSKKELGKTAFKDTEKVLIKKMLEPIFPQITIDEIFYHDFF